MDFVKESCETFVQKLSTKSPVPGGGGASALVGALGTALGNMVGSLTVGKKKYADVQGDIENLMEKATMIQEELLELVGRDAEVFAPLAEAYSLPSQTDDEKLHKEAVMEEALVGASRVPMDIAKCCAKAITLHDEFAKKGSVIAVSDAGVGVLFCKAAMQGAVLNVKINTKAMKNRDIAKKYNDEADDILKNYTVLADEVYAYVSGKLDN